MMSRTYQIITRVMPLFVVVLMLLSVALDAKPKQEDWRTRENLVLRLGAEWYKISVLSKEISSVNDVLSDIRDLEVFPSSLTGLDDATLVVIDKKIEVLEKRSAILKANVDMSQPQLADAMAILREMVIGNPVEGMFDVLEKGDLKRIDEMFVIKHQIDSLWRGTDTLLNSIMGRFKIAYSTKSNSDIFEEEFFAILRANLGQQSEEYYRKLNIVKDYLVKKGNNSEVNTMYKVESKKISDYLATGKGAMALNKVQNMQKRYEQRIDKNELSRLLAKVQFTMGDYEKTIQTLSVISDSSSVSATKVVYRFQSLYAIQQYETVWKEGQTLDFKKFSGQTRNVLLWVTMESGLALKAKGDYTQFASLMDKNAMYSLHVMHSLARSYLQANDKTMALSVFEGALKIKSKSDVDKIAYNRIRLDVAQICYEIGSYEKALLLFFDLLNDNETFDKALFGIVWCYLKTDDNNKAETSLRKLINQNPSSPLAAEAILVLAKEYVIKAHHEWKKLNYLTKEESRLYSMVERLHKKEMADTSKGRNSKYSFANDELKMLLSRLKSEPRMSFSGIQSYFTKASRICDMISNNYSTGTFQEAQFSQKRENLLEILDSLIVGVKGGGSKTAGDPMLSNALQSRLRIKAVVDTAMLVRTEIGLDQYRWEREYIAWTKSILNEKKQTIVSNKAKGSDSVVLATNVARLKAEMDSLVNADDKLRAIWSKSLISEISFLLSTDLDSNSQAYFSYHLGELYYAEENASHAIEYERYETELMRYEDLMVSYRDGANMELPRQPLAPVLAHRKSIMEFNSVLRAQSTGDYAAAAHYCLAWCYNDMGSFDSALTHMQTVATNYPTSVHAPQAWMYCGEYLFDKGDLDKAISCYHSVMKYPESDWFDDALYKLAWAQYRMSNPEKAISSFLALVGLGGSKSKGKALLEKESMDYIAISFSETDITGEKGLERAALFVKKFGDQDRGSEILHRLATVYKDQGRYDMAKKTFRTLLKMYPDYRGSPMIESEYLAVLERDVNSEESNKMKMDYFRKYNKSSSWASVQTDEHVKTMADSASSKQLYNAAIGYHQSALQKNDTVSYATAVDAYEEFIRNYPSSLLANECHYNLAEIEFSLGDYYKAAEDYMTVSKRYPDSKYRETAAWNAIVASQNFLKQEEVVK